MALTPAGYIPIAADRFLEPIRVTRAGNGDLTVTLPYIVRVGLLDRPHTVLSTAPEDEASMKNMFNSLFYAVNNTEDGDIDPDYVPFGQSEPPPGPP